MGDNNQPSGVLPVPHTSSNDSGSLPGSDVLFADLDEDAFAEAAPFSSGSSAFSGMHSVVDARTPVPDSPRRTTGNARRFPLLRVLLLVAVVAAVLGSVSFALANQTPLKSTSTAGTSTSLTHRPGVTPRTKPTPTAIPTTQAFDWVPAQLPTAWTASGLNAADAMEALRTAMTFTDREMSLDFRNAGTAAQPAGTFTAATFLLTPGGRQRFNQNDVRVASPTLFTSVQQRQLIQEVINAQPTIVQVQSQGQQQFARANVAFQLFQSQLGNNGQRVEGKEVTVMGEPVTHHMIVLLLRVAPAQQGANAPMGGTGWLVSNYALDEGSTLPPITQPV